MWCLETDTGIYALKVLNPEIMSRPDAKLNYQVSERVAQVASSKGIQAVPAKTIGLQPWFESNGQYIMVFDWIYGHTVAPENCKIEHCRRIGELLFQIHSLDIQIEEFHVPRISPTPDFAWQQLIENARSGIDCWGWSCETLMQHVSKWSGLYHDSIRNLPPQFVMSHRDLDSKNVLWKNGTVPYVIDWESAGYINPMVELIEVAFNWSQGIDGISNKERFQGVIEAYLQAGGELHGRILDSVYASLGSMLGWLEYNMRRSLDEDVFHIDERELGYREVLRTINELTRFTDAGSVYAGWAAELGWH